MMRRTLWAGALGSVLILSSSSIAAATDLRVERETFGTIGGIDAGGPYRHGFTVGQSAAGRATSSGHVETAGFWQSIGVAVDAPLLPRELPNVFALGRPAPNPFAGRTTFRYSVPGGAGRTRVTIRIFDIAGRSVRVLTRGTLPPGLHSATWDGVDDSGSRVSNGVYFCAMEATSFRAVRRVVLIR